MAYWVASLVLIGFGLLAGFSIGQPFFLVGMAMLVLGVFRHRPLIFWPPMLAVVAYNIVYWTVAPGSCLSTMSAVYAGQTVCTSLLGIRYEGEGLYNPSLWPAVVAGLVVAAVVLGVTFVTLLRRERRGRRAQ